MSEHELAPVPGSVVLEPSDATDDKRWSLQFVDVDTGDEVRVWLSPEQLEEVDGEFTEQTSVSGTSSSGRSFGRDRETGHEDLSDEELLERIAELDPDRFPLATTARRALERGGHEGEWS